MGYFYWVERYLKRAESNLIGICTFTLEESITVPLRYSPRASVKLPRSMPLSNSLVASDAKSSHVLDLGRLPA
jgi:hypothetical protein